MFGSPAAFCLVTQMAQLFTGRSMPLVGLGTWKSKPGEVEAAVKTALEVGYRSIDCAAVYGNEKDVGTALKAEIANGLVKREELFITSKLWNTKHAKEDVRPSCVKTLADLGLDYLDLYLIHWPISFQSGDNVFPKDEKGNLIYGDVPLLETWEAMEALVDEGLVRAIGVSNFNSKQLDAVINASRKHRPAVLQIESHVYFTQKPLIEFAHSRGVVVTAYSPLGSPDRPWVKATDPRPLDDPKLHEIGAKYGKTAAQVALRYQIQRGVVVIPKSVSASRLKENLNVFDFTLSAEDFAAVEALNRNFRGCIPLIMVDGVEVARDAAHREFPFNEPF